LPRRARLRAAEAAAVSISGARRLHAMMRISSRRIVFYKWVFPAAWFGVLALALISMLASRAFEKSPLLLVIPCVVAAFGYLFMKKLAWDLADEVYDCGDHLLIRARGEEQQVPLSNIMNVSASTLVNPSRITLRLLQPGRLGAEIAFSPVAPFSLNPFAKNAVAEDLMARVDAARTERGQ
jgi:hypothetical protein